MTRLKNLFKGCLLAGILFLGWQAAKAGDGSFAISGPYGPNTFDARTNGESELRQVFVIGDATTTPNVAPVSATSGLATEQRANTVASYIASSGTISVAVSTTDICTLTGSATKTVKVTYVVVTATQTTASNIGLLLLKRSSADSGVVYSTFTAVPLDSNNSAATAVARSFTASPVLGTIVGNIDVARMLVPAFSTAGLANYGTSWGFLNQPITLRGTGDVLAVNLGGITITGGVFSCGFIWTEE